MTYRWWTPISSDQNRSSHYELHPRKTSILVLIVHRLQWVKSPQEANLFITVGLSVCTSWKCFYIDYYSVYTYVFTYIVISCNILVRYFFIYPNFTFQIMLHFCQVPCTLFFHRPSLDSFYWWCHMGMFPSLLALCGGNPPVTSRVPWQTPSDGEIWCFLCSLILA